VRAEDLREMDRRLEEFVAAQTEASELRGMGHILERGLTERALSSS
jgi:hypothetical protein